MASFRQNREWYRVCDMTAQLLVECPVQNPLSHYCETRNINLNSACRPAGLCKTVQLIRNPAALVLDSRGCKCRKEVTMGTQDPLKNLAPQRIRSTPIRKLDSLKQQIQRSIRAPGIGRAQKEWLQTCHLLLKNPTD
jgi:hypothetical protein